ncbi:hypothetical protein GCM10010349_73410 [Streptomyces flavofungini]|nr:hypothetical protein GCM10010349_73410 [Streptomyces flavofungini]
MTVFLRSASTGALIGPVVFHRMVSGRRIKPQAVIWASRLTVVGLILLLCTLASALLLILRVATHDWAAPALVAVILVWYLRCWFGLPLWAKRRYTDSDADSEAPAAVDNGQ